MGWAPEKETLGSDQILGQEAQSSSSKSRTSRMAGSTPFFKRPLTTSDPGKDQQGLGNLEPTC